MAKYLPHFIILAILLSGCLSAPLQKRSPEHIDEDEVDTDEEDDILVEDDSTEIDDQSSITTDLLATHLFEGPFTREQVHQIGLRLVEISAPSTNQNALSRLCRYGESIDSAARSLYRFLTEDGLAQGSIEDSDNPSQHTTTSTSDYCQTYEVTTERRRVSFQKMKNILTMYDSGASIKTIKAKYPDYRPSSIKRYRECVQVGPGPDNNRMTRMERVNDRVYELFEQAFNASLPIHDEDIQSWGRRAADELGAPSSFTASLTWVLSFKRRYKIGSRAVTGYTSAAQQRQKEPIGLSKAVFKRDFARLEAYLQRRFIINMDQTSFNEEMSNKRTLAKKGVRDVMQMVDSMSKTTHSYTSQPMITREGRTFGKLLLCLREPSGRFGPQVSQQVERDERDFRNIRVFASKSGKMDKQLMLR